VPLLLSERDVRELLTMPLALEAVEEVFRRMAASQTVLHVRRRMQLPDNAFLHYMAGADIVSGYMGMKIYTSVRGALRFLVPLYRAQTGELLALIEADYLGQMRTGAASGVATKYMSRSDATTVGIVGTGSQARTQLEAVCAVRKIASVRALGRDANRRTTFAREMSAKLGVRVTPVESAEEAVRGADIVVTATTSSRPVVHGAWLAPGAHINAVGANFPQKRELDDEAVMRAAVIAADSIEESKIESGDLIETVGRNPDGWSTVRELADVVSGKLPGRTSPADITLFKSNGIAIEDVAVGARVYELAVDRGIGRQVSMWTEQRERADTRGD
jgi:ornithine cyclodeaminase/alanine dehydrogenase-like protein (mu-crystallin family)